MKFSSGDTPDRHYWEGRGIEMKGRKGREAGRERK